MNLPNKLTMIRILLVPFFVVFIYMDHSSVCQMIGLAIFVIASLTDLLDGKIARRRNLVTDFGKFMDPIADKLLVMSALIILVEQNRMPGWVCMLMLAREFIISGFRLVASTKGTVIAAGIWGKLKTVSQMIYIPMAIMLIPMRELDAEAHTIWDILTDIMMYVSLALTLYSGFSYVWSNKHHITDM
ncbi:MAG: CDP-diacylglycerol--glycerol-3-phosphate 3-phosphatidyltransferase [Clostridia bacterium]|nr:CDP-diacylglycerol--glycerol-3-phosphate 3-phosphatidyltransferase [Clostridia bacterium]